MLPVLDDYLERLAALHSSVETAISGLSTEALDWVPGAGMNSMAVLVTHLAGAEGYWIGAVAAEKPSGRVRETEFQVRGQGAEALAGLLAQTLSMSRAVVSGLTAADLEALRVSPRDGKRYTVSWCLYHALEHTALHLGHLQLTRELWDQRIG